MAFGVPFWKHVAYLGACQNLWVIWFCFGRGFVSYHEFVLVFWRLILVLFFGPYGKIGTIGLLEMEGHNFLMSQTW